MKKKSLQIQQMDTKMGKMATLRNTPQPPSGWIRAIRSALGMSLQQLGNRLSMTRQSAQEIEKREQSGAITLKSLREAAQALDMQLVYGFVPRDGSLEALIDRKAEELAWKIVMRASQTMVLEDQQNSGERLQKAILERTAAIKAEMPKALWD